MELYIRKAEKSGSNQRCHQVGDVISMCPDGWAWGSAEIASQEHIIQLVPGASMADFSFLTVRHEDGVQRRGYRIDLDGLPNPCSAVQLSAAIFEA